MNDQIRSLFIATSHYAYLNSAAVSPLPATAIRGVIDQMMDVSSNGGLGYLGWLKHKETARTLLASTMNVRPEQIAFTRNTSDGIATIANGLPWDDSRNIVTFANEFPANWYPWKRIRDEYGVEIRLCPEREGRIDLDELCSMIDENTRVVAISAVQYASGFKADLERIGKAARDVDALFVVDVIQALGGCGFDLPAQYVDVASGAGHKWLCAPEGCGFVYISDRARERVKPTLVGWISVDTLSPGKAVPAAPPFSTVSSKASSFSPILVSTTSRTTPSVSPTSSATALAARITTSSAHARPVKSRPSSASGTATASPPTRSLKASRNIRSSSPHAATACVSQRIFTTIPRISTACSTPSLN